MVVRTHADRVQYAPCILLCLLLFGRNMPSIVQNGKLFVVRSKANNCFLHVTIGMLFIVLCIVKLLASHLHLVYIG